MNLPDWSLRELALFQLVIELGTVTAAAQRLGVTQSAASRILAGFERKTGAVLFQRMGRNLLPTTAAQALLGRVNAVLQAAQENIEPAPDDRMLLRVGAPPSFADGLVSEALARFSTLMPQCRTRTEVLSTPMILDALSEGDLDIGMTDTHLRNPNLSSIIFRAASLYCFAAPETAVAQLPVASLQDLAGERVVMLTRRHGSRSFLDRQFHSAGIASADMPGDMIEASSAQAALWMAHHIKGVALLSPFPLLGYMPVPLKAIPFTPEFRYNIQFLLPRKIAPGIATRLFMSAVRDIARRQDDHSTEIPVQSWLS